MTQVTKRYKYRLYPTKSQCDLLARSFGCARKVWNECLGRLIKEYEDWRDNPDQPKPGVSAIDFNRKLTQLKAELPYLREVAAVPLQQVTRHLALAFTNFFKSLKGNKPVGYPKFKKKGNRNSITLVGTAIRIKDGQVYMPLSQEPLNIRWSRALPSEPTSCTISQNTDGKYYISFVCLTDPHLTNGEGQVGIDLGLTSLAVLSDGTVIENPKYLAKSQRRLAHYQRRLSKKTKGSNNRNKARIKVARIHAKIRNQRDDFLHKLSRKLVNENQVISMESLKPSNMLKNRNLAKGIHDASWSKLVDFIRYKARESHHCQLVVMDPYYPSSKLCSVCGFKHKELTLKDRFWDCGGCGTRHDRDHNAAINILNKGLATRKSLSPQGQWTDKVMVGTITPVLL